VRTADGREASVRDLAAEQPCPRPRAWPRGGAAAAVEVWLPEVGEEPFLLVVGWRFPHCERPLVLPAGPAARRRGRTARWFVRAYRRRRGAEDATRGVKQRSHLESFLVRTWRALRRRLWLVARAFWWRNLWGEERFGRLREALRRRPGRLPKPVTSLFDWIAAMLRQLLHPHPKIKLNTG
jgi:hypothetical protein